MRVPIRGAGALLAAVLLIASQTIPLAVRRGGYADPVPPPVLHAVRESLAAINQFVVDGDVEALWQSLDRTGHGLDPWPQMDVAQRDVAALAFRSTFPGVQLHLASIEQTERLYAVRVRSETAATSWPGWLSPSRAPSASDYEVLLDFDSGGTLQRADAQTSSGPMVYDAPASETAFLLPPATRLVASRITLTAAGHGTRYLALSDPGIVAPESGTLLAQGEGRILAFSLGAKRWRQISSDEQAEIAPGDLLYLLDGYMVLTMSSTTPAQLVYSAVVSTVRHPAAESEHGQTAPADLAGMMETAPNTPAPVWFGFIQSVASSAAPAPAGMARLDVIWLVLSAGDQVALAPGTLFVAYDQSDAVVTAERPSAQTRIANPTNLPLTILVLRAVPV